MTTTATTGVRDDLFTHIHKGLRLGLFELAINVGRTDWNDPAAVTEIGNQWRPLLGLLRAHTKHEEGHIHRLLDAYDPIATEPASDQHRDLDDLLDHLATRFDAALAEPDAATGLTLYRDLTRFVAAYLAHLYDEETRIMGRIWECCSDEEIATTRAVFMVEITPEIQDASLRYMLPAINQPTRRGLAAGLAGAPPAVAKTVLALAEEILSPADAADLLAAAHFPPASAQN
jgi:hypothetical protein